MILVISTPQWAAFSNIKLYTSIIKSGHSPTEQSVGRSDEASLGTGLDTDSIFDALVQDAFAELDALANVSGADDCEAQDAPLEDGLDDLVQQAMRELDAIAFDEEICNNVIQQKSESVDGESKPGALGAGRAGCGRPFQEGQEDDPQTTTTIMIMSIITIARSTSAAKARTQGFKVPTGNATVLRQHIRSGDCWDREVVSPDRRVSVGIQDKSACDLGESSASTLDETKTKQLGITSHGVEGSPASEGSPSGDPASRHPAHHTKTSLETRHGAVDSSPMGQPSGQSFASSSNSTVEETVRAIESRTCVLWQFDEDVDALINGHTQSAQTSS